MKSNREKRIKKRRFLFIITLCTLRLLAIPSAMCLFLGDTYRVGVVKTIIRLSFVLVTCGDDVNHIAL